MTIAKLFTPLTLGGKHPQQLLHRVVMPPLTRCRAGEAGVPPEISVTYYGLRATEGGLIIAEATNISPTDRGFYGSPGIFNDAQVAGWKPVTTAVHDKGGKIFLQLWHTGRTGHKTTSLVVSYPSRQLPPDLPVSKARTSRPSVVASRSNAALNALDADFDGVELHAANGYLLEQFLHDGINDCTDEYGGAVENRARFLFEALDAIVEKVDSSKVGIRLSPYGVVFGQMDSDPVSTYNYVLGKLNAYNLAYAHLIEPRSYHVEHPLTPAHGAAHQFRDIYNGVIITASGYTRETAMDAVEEGDADAVAIGRNFISNPDLVQRLKSNTPLTPWDADTFYGRDMGAKGYTDYPFLNEQ